MMLTIALIILGIFFVPWFVSSFIWYIIGCILKIKKGDLWRVKDFIFPLPDKFMGIEVGECGYLPIASTVLLFSIIYRCLRPYVCEILTYLGEWVNKLLNYEVIKGKNKKESKSESKKPGLWVARDENGTLCLYLGKPKKNGSIWEGTESTMGIYQDCLPNHCIPLWIDDEPDRSKTSKSMIENNMINKKTINAVVKAACEVVSPGGCQIPNEVVDVDYSPDDIIVKDLLPRIPYHVKVECGVSTGPYTLDGLNPNGISVAQVTSPMGITWDFRIDCIKPYLRSYNSLTDSEKEEYEELKEDLESGKIEPWKCFKFLEWCYKHHLDINDLIPMGLAFEAPEDMYNFA